MLAKVNCYKYYGNCCDLHYVFSNLLAAHKCLGYFISEYLHEGPSNDLLHSEQENLTLMIKLFSFEV